MGETNIEVTLTSHLGDLRNAVDDQINKALNTIGLMAESYAKDNITAAGRVDTGILRNSISHEVDGTSVVIGTNVEYAMYHELGTGIYADGGGGRQTPWFYTDRNGETHRTVGVEPVHFLRDAVQDHIDEYRDVLDETLRE